MNVSLCWVYSTEQSTVFLAAASLEEALRPFGPIFRVTSGDAGSPPFHIDPILPDPLILETETDGVLEQEAALEIKLGGFQTGVKSSRALWLGPAFSPSLTSLQETLLLSALCHGVMWNFLRKWAPFLSCHGWPSNIHSYQMAILLSFPVIGWKQALLANEE